MTRFYELDPAVQRQKSFTRLVDYLRRVVVRYHPYLRRRYAELGLDLARQLQTPADLTRLPLVTKDELRTQPQAFVVRPDLPGVPTLPGYPTDRLQPRHWLKYALQAGLNWPRDDTRPFRRPTWREKVARRVELEWSPCHFHASSGTSGRPTPAIYTHYDLNTVLRHLANILILPQVRQPGVDYYQLTERSMSLFPGAPHLAFFSTVLTKILAGTCAFDTCGGAVIPTDRQVALFAEGGFTALLGIPSYLVHWLRRAIALQVEGRLAPLVNLKHMVLGAEPVSGTLRQHLHQLARQAGAAESLKIYETIGMTEMKWWFGQCAETSGMHLNPYYYFWELLHPKTKQPVAEGEPGVLVFSHIGWRGTVLIRYWTGDLVQGGLRWQRCQACGYSFPLLFGPIQRAEQDFTKVKGTLVDLAALVDVVRSTPGVRLFQCSLENFDETGSRTADRLRLCVLCEPDQLPDELGPRLLERVKRTIDVTPHTIDWEHDETALHQRLFARSPVKAEYVVDRRNEENERGG